MTQTTIEYQRPYIQGLTPTIKTTKEQSPEDSKLLSYSADDRGNAESVLLLYGDKINYVSELGWLCWNGTHWQKDRGAVLVYIMDTLKRRRLLAVDAMNHESIVQATRGDNYKFQNCMSVLEAFCTVNISEFDNDPDLLNVSNGVIHLPTGTLLEHDTSQKFTYCLDTEYKKDANYDVWQTWLRDTVKGENEMEQFLQEWCGYCLTGRTNEEKLLYIQGETRSGKGTFTETLRALMPTPLSAATSFNTFTLRRDGSNQNFDLAPLKAARLVVASESDRHDKLNGALLKAITGGDSVSCAFKGKDMFSYRPQYKIVLTTNWQANFDPDDTAISARLIVAEFPHSHLGEEDMSLKERFKRPEFLEGVLLWAVEGAMCWYKRGSLDVPEISKSTKEQWRDNLDTVSQWLEECCTLEQNDYTPSSIVRESYTTWCEEYGHKPQMGTTFNQALMRRGLLPNRSIRDENTKRVFKAVKGLKTVLILDRV